MGAAGGGARTSLLRFRGTWEVSLGAFQTGLLQYLVAEGVEGAKQSGNTGEADCLSIWSQPAVEPGVSYSTCVCVL